MEKMKRGINFIVNNLLYVMIVFLLGFVFYDLFSIGVNTLIMDIFAVIQILVIIILCWIAGWQTGRKE